ncbi:D-alanine--D-alanine ligase [Brumimicrobium aurantiacum]|uniref:D-alanine--D-alanine ligase n=1 Tax=Brumimicrobium aurantiacum TaxID=1737063 RepID=A0A3E1EU96_9FLAO|nr:D-alanine--D-alanine ligase [Brumimicrobium aurantiacum]RFC53127.1 D-alanine--D-alanine ligase [Brumimicrobium aurantiacum]
MINVGIFCGGYSSEFEISIKSANMILDHLPKDEYNAFLVRVNEKGWFADYKGETLEVSPIDFSFVLESGERIVIELAHVYIHGDPGENGKLQAYFEMKKLPFVNSSALSSELSFDKWFCNQFLKGFGVEVAESYLILKNSHYNTELIGEKLGFPMFVKPADSGSSYGISKVYELEDLQNAIDEAFAEGNTVVCEAFLKGTEVTCGVYRNSEGIHPLPCTEIISESDFFDYEAKYLGKSKEITPAGISEKLTSQIQELTVLIYQLLQMRSLGRVDYMIVDGKIYVIEVNTTPGFSKESLVPQMLDCADISIGEFWTEIYEFERKQFGI